MMRSTGLFILTILSLLVAAGAAAQNPADLRIGEVLVENTNGLIDDFGQRNGWIEIFNNSNGTVKFGGCYLSDDSNNLTKYHIPTSDLSAKVGPRQSVVFYASGDASQGTYYTNFTLRRGSAVFLVSNDGRTVIDKIDIPSDLPADHSVVRVPVGVKEMDFETKINERPSPGYYNGDVDAKTKNQIMKENDPHGFVLTLIAVSVVFSALIILSIIFGWIGRANRKSQSGEKKHPKKRVKAVKAGELNPEIAAAISMALSKDFGSEVYAAIAMALDVYFGDGIHDTESFVITIKPSAGSNWADKTQTFRQLPR